MFRLATISLVLLLVFTQFGAIQAQESCAYAQDISETFKSEDGQFLAFAGENHLGQILITVDDWTETSTIYTNNTKTEVPFIITEAVPFHSDIFWAGYRDDKWYLGANSSIDGQLIFFTNRAALDAPLSYVLEIKVIGNRLWIVTSAGVMYDYHPYLIGDGKAHRFSEKVVTDASIDPNGGAVIFTTEDGDISIWKSGETKPLTFDQAYTIVNWDTVGILLTNTELTIEMDEDLKFIQYPLVMGVKKARFALDHFVGIRADTVISFDPYCSESYDPWTEEYEVEPTSGIFQLNEKIYIWRGSEYFIITSLL